MTDVLWLMPDPERPGCYLTIDEVLRNWRQKHPDKPFPGLVVDEKWLLEQMRKIEREKEENRTHNEK